jgi:hypothetical protein
MGGDDAQLAYPAASTTQQSRLRAQLGRPSRKRVFTDSNYVDRVRVSGIATTVGLDEYSDAGLHTNFFRPRRTDMTQ